MEYWTSILKKCRSGIYLVTNILCNSLGFWFIMHDSEIIVRA